MKRERDKHVFRAGRRVTNDTSAEPQVTAGRWNHVVIRLHPAEFGADPQEFARNGVS